ncbi:DNA (cytosine-5-)-methyltransferase [Bacillus wiedmannii]|uniref:DNA cytosine methyltransferase n=1 Tax=Bacillus wiedmannii TaxID=1890302 RepID=UPI003D250539
MELDSYKKPTVVSLFCGAGGMDYGFQQAGFELILGIDINKDCCETYKNWSGANIANIDINKVDINQIPDSDVIILGLPAPSISVRGKKRVSVNSNVDLLNVTYKIVGNKRPKAFVLECFAGLLSINKGKNFYELLISFQELGYNITYEVVNSRDYGIAQNKKKLVMVGIREDLCLRYDFPLKEKLRVTVREVLRDLEIKNNEKRKIIKTEQISKYKSHYTIIDLDTVSPSLKIPEKMVIINDNGDYVSLLCEEAALIQSFSENVIFMGSRGSKMRQIVHAFPPKLAFVIAERLRDILKDKEQMDNSGEENIVNNHSPILIHNSNIVNTNQVSQNTRQLRLKLSEEKSIVNDDSIISFVNSNLVNTTKRVFKKEKQVSLSLSNTKKLDIGEKLIFKINQINPGREQAQDYHDWVFESLSYIFDKELRRGRKEVPINRKRKRVDIIFDNMKSEGFFYDLKHWENIQCKNILIECKNYNGDLKNPEFDQLIGRFNRSYSEFGIITCRSIVDEEKNIARCRDIRISGKGHVLTLCDADIIALLKLRDEKKYEGISDYMRALYDKIIY